MWLYIPQSASSLSTPSPYAQVAGGLISASNWQFQAIARSLTWRGKPSHALIWSRRWNKVFWLRRLCGAMPEPFLADSFAAAWIASLAVSHANRTRLPESASDAKTSATSGPPSVASSSRRGLGAHSSKTCPVWPHPAGLSASGETFTDWVLRLRQDSSARKKLVRAMAARGSSCSPSINKRWNTALVADAGEKVTLASRQAGLMGDAITWATPAARDWRSGLASEKSLARNSRPLSEQAASQWPTPGAAKANNDAGLMKSGDGREKPNKLGWAAGSWPTPMSLSFDGSHQPGNNRSGNKMLEIAANWSTPTAHDGRRPGLDIHSTQGANLSKDVGVWPTIRAAEAGGYQYSRGNRNKPVPTLTGAGTAWSTPSVADVTGGRMSRSGDRSDEALMKRQAEMVANLAATLANGLSSRPARATSYGAPSQRSILSAFQRYRAMTCSSMRAELRALIRMAIRAERAGQRRGFTRPSYRKSLNARFVAWLMGWPDHWTRTASMPSACSATALSLWRARMRSELSALPLPGDMAPIQPDLFGERHD